MTRFWTALLFGLLSLVGGFVAFYIMASDRHYPFSVQVGGLGCVIACVGLLGLLRLGATPAPEADQSVPISDLAPRLIEWFAALVAVVIALRLAVGGVMPWPRASSGVLVTLTMLWLVVSTGRLRFVFAAPGAPTRALLASYGFWLVVLNVLLHVPLLGSFSLIDPWESHYGEVAREMLSRDDWISTWWAQDGWFFSKPVLDLWLQALSFALFGVRYAPDQMLASAASGALPQPEWAARIPIFALSVLGLYVLYRGLGRVFSKRVAFLSCLILSCTPYWLLLVRQTMTDMPYAAPLAAAFGFLLLALYSDPTKQSQSYAVVVGRYKLGVSKADLLLGAILVTVVPQVLYLLSRNITLKVSAPPYGFWFHADLFMRGSGGGNCGLPGNQDCAWVSPMNPKLQPGFVALFWAAMAGVLAWTQRNERRVERLAFIAAWYAVALSAMAKGAPGLVIPVAAFVGFIAVSRRWATLERAELWSFVMIVGCVVLPWWLAMYVRHGPQFIERLLFHDMYKRAFEHVHDTNVGDDTSFRYYLWQLGYGLFPWSGLAAMGLLGWAAHDAKGESAKTPALSLFGLWFIAGFCMFTLSLTKFHHYALPIVPPLAVMAAIVLDRALGDRFKLRGAPWLSLLGLFLGTSCLLVGACFGVPGQIFGTVVDLKRPAAPNLIALLLCVPVGGVLAVLSLRRLRTDYDPTRPDPDALVVGVFGFVATLLVVLVLRDLVAELPGDVQGQARLLHLFSYNYSRAWPDSLDFRGAILCFGALSALFGLGFVSERLRPYFALLFTASALCWAVWLSDVYLFRTAPHWGQRENLLVYYRERKGPEEPFIAYQMNWKGENFYTGNHVPAFVSSGKTFKNWIEQRRKSGERVLFFTTEHSRINTLKSELGSVKSFRVLTDESQNNKFFVARVEL